jgi:hypothetical protein
VKAGSANPTMTNKTTIQMTILTNLLFLIARLPKNQPRRNEDREGRTEEIFAFFVSSWLIFR